MRNYPRCGITEFRCGVIRATLSGKPRVLFKQCSLRRIDIGLQGEPRVIERLILNVDWQQEERSQRAVIATLRIH